MNKYMVRTNQVFVVYESVAIKRLVSILLFLTLVAYQSVSLSESVSVTNVLGTSLLSPSSEESEEGFLERFSSGAFPGQPPRNEVKKRRVVEGNKLMPLQKSINRIKTTPQKRKASSSLSVPNTGNVVILRKYDAVIERVNNKQSEHAKNRDANDSVEPSASKKKLDLTTYYDSDKGEPAPESLSLDIHNDPADFDIDLSETGIVVRYLW